MLGLLLLALLGAGAVNGVGVEREQSRARAFCPEGSRVLLVYGAGSLLAAVELVRQLWEERIPHLRAVGGRRLASCLQSPSYLHGKGRGKSHSFLAGSFLLLARSPSPSPGRSLANGSQK